MSGKCAKTNCICTHTDPCEYGYIWTRYKEITPSKLRNGLTIENESWYDVVSFCPTCDPERAHIQNTSTSSDQMQERLKARSQFNVAENYDKTEQGRTRTL